MEAVDVEFIPFFLMFMIAGGSFGFGLYLGQRIG